MDPNPDFQRFAPNKSLTLNYDIKIDEKSKNDLLGKIVDIKE